MRLPIGTRSLLWGAHAFYLHPFFVAMGWTRLFGFPTDWRLWLAFVLHDLGYAGKPNMDGPEGETHVEWAARVMRWLCGDYWGDFCLYHSRFYAKRDHRHYSMLCVADKLAIVLTPAWLYLPMANLSGEINEYKKLAKVRGSLDTTGNKYESMNLWSSVDREWYEGVQSYLLRWVIEHRDFRPDAWTPDMGARIANEQGVWR